MFCKFKVYKGREMFFATDPSISQTVLKIVETFKTLDEKFPESEGFTLDVCLYPLTFSRHAWKLIVNELHDSKSLTMVLLSKL